MLTHLIECVRSFAGRRVLLIGDLILDRYVYGDAERISPEAPVPVLRVRERKEGVGGAANVAACLRALEVDVSCCGVVGDDVMGQRLQRMIGDLGVDPSGIITCPDRPTTTKTRFVGLAQHRHRQQLLRLDEENNGPLSAETDRRLRGLAAERAAQVDVVCIEDYDKGLISDSLVAEIVQVALKARKPILVDPARLATYERYRGTTLLTPNRSELGVVAGREIESVKLAGECGASACRETDHEALVVTLDRDGAVVARRDGSWTHLPTRPRSVYDNTGAGDAVLAMLAAAYHEAPTLEDAVRLANIAGGLEVEKFGCVPITTEEVLADLRLEHGRRSGKLRTLPQLLAELTLRRDRGETIVFTNGCFDLLHPGHVDFLARCREQGSVLVVGLNSDASVRAQKKGNDRPIFDQSHRATMLGAVESVDYVVTFDEPDPGALIERVAPDVLVKGEDWSDKGVIGARFVESRGGRVVLLPLVDGYSTTSLVSRIRNGVS